MSRRGRSRHIEIFNFSFLDILACTIGLLIFILVMVFILQAGSPLADTEGIVRRNAASASAASEAAERDLRIAQTLEAQLDKIRPAFDRSLELKRERARQQRDAIQTTFSSDVKEINFAEIQLEGAKRTRDRKANIARQQNDEGLAKARALLEQSRHKLEQARAAPSDERLSLLPRAEGGENPANFQILHVECKRDSVTVLSIGDDGIAREASETAAPSVADDDSAFMASVRQHQKQPNPLIVFWVRPNGISTFNRAVAALPPGIAHGFEPAEEGWRFGRK